MLRSRLTRRVLPLCLLCLPILGCSPPEPADSPTSSVQGQVFSGKEPLAKFQVTVLDSDFQTSLGSTVTDSDGRFQITYDDPSSSDAIVYVVAAEPHTPVDPTLATVFEFSSKPTVVRINERTTVATAYALARFIGTNRSLDPPPGMSTAVGMAHHFVDVGNGELGPVIQNPVNRDTDVLPTFNSLANLISGCIQGIADVCAQLAESTQANDTLGALVQLAHDPSLHAQELFDLSQQVSPYEPALEQAPGAWTLALRFIGVPETMNGPGNFAIDSEGTIWVANNYTFFPEPGTDGAVCASHKLLRFTPTGAGYPGSPYEGGGLDGAGFGISVDPYGNVWVGNFGFVGQGCTVPAPAVSVSEFDPDGNALSPVGGIRAGGTIDRPQGTVSDAKGNIWIANCGSDSVTILWGGSHDDYHKVPSSELAIEQPFDIAHNSQGQAYVTGNKSSSVAVLDPDGTPVSYSPLAGFDRPMGVAVDSQDNVWVANSGGVQVPCSRPEVEETQKGSLTLIRADGSVSEPMDGGGLTLAWGLTVDGNDNVWVANFSEQRLSHFCGVPETGCPRGKKAGEPISPDGTGYGFDGLTRNTGVVVDASGNVWLTNNWKNEVNLANPGGYEIVAFIGLAEPVARPQREMVGSTP